MHSMTMGNFIFFSIFFNVSQFLNKHVSLTDGCESQ